MILIARRLSTGLIDSTLAISIAGPQDMFKSIGEYADPPGIAPGSPEGSYGFGGAESIDLFGGRLKYELALFRVGERLAFDDKCGEVVFDSELRSILHATSLLRAVYRDYWVRLAIQRKLPMLYPDQINELRCRKMVGAQNRRPLAHQPTHHTQVPR